MAQIEALKRKLILWIERLAMPDGGGGTRREDCAFRAVGIVDDRRRGEHGPVPVLADDGERLGAQLHAAGDFLALAVLYFQSLRQFAGFVDILRN